MQQKNTPKNEQILLESDILCCDAAILTLLIS
jgi:hypothetical protein